MDYQNDEVWLAKEAIEFLSRLAKCNYTCSVTISVTVVDGKFHFDGKIASATTLKSGATYTFDQSDSSNLGNPLRFSETTDGTNNGGAQYSGIVFVGTPGEEGSTTQFTVSDETASSLYIYSEAAVGMGNEALMTATPAVTMELQTISGIGWQIDPNYGDLNPVIDEIGDFSYAITSGPDAALFRISDQGTISFKDTAPDPSNPNDSDSNGEYLITIVTDILMVLHKI